MKKNYDLQATRAARRALSPISGFNLNPGEEEEEWHGGSQQSAQATQQNKPESKTPALDTFGTDLTARAEAEELDPVVGRTEEILRVAQILTRRKKNNPILIGEPGVGKSAIVEGLAQRIVRRQVPQALRGCRLGVLDMASVVAGTKYRGQFEERLRAIMTELKENPKTIVFVDEIHTIIGAGSAPGTMDAANMLKPALSRGEIRCIGATTLAEYRKSIEKDGALERRFQKVSVGQPTAEETLAILQNLQPTYEQHHRVRYTAEALKACVTLTERYVSDRSFPDKAIDALDEAGSAMHMTVREPSKGVLHMESEVLRLGNEKKAALERQDYETAADLHKQLRTAEKALDHQRRAWEEAQDGDTPTVGREHVERVVSRMTGVPVERMGSDEHKRLRSMATRLAAKVIGQDEAVGAITRSIQRSRLGLKDPHRPIGTFLFVGPTGVGKTFLTQTLAEEMFGTKDALIRVDMSEYMEKHTVSRMIGSPPGYVGYDEGGQLTERVRRRPYSIVLLDEIEKAHPDVLNLLLQVMDEGRLTDGNGATIDFRNTIIVMTSNAGTRQVKDFGQGVGFSAGTDASKDFALQRSLIEKTLRKQFAPEFLNRLTDVVYFRQLAPQSICRIVDIELRPLQERMAAMGHRLCLTPKAKELLGAKGYDPQYGARPLKRAIETLVEDPICQLMLEGRRGRFTVRASEGNIAISNSK